MTAKIAEQLNTKVAATHIRNNIAVAESPAHGTGLLNFAPKANACLDYKKFIKELLDGGL